MVETAVRPHKATKIDPRDRQQLAESPVPWRRVAAMFAPHRTQLALVTTVIVASSVIGLAQPFLIKALIDTALPTYDRQLLMLLCAGLVGVAAVTGALGVAQTWIATLIGQRVMHTLRTDVFRHVQSQSLDFFKRTRSGEIQSRMTNDIAGMRNVITNSATSIASNLTTVVATAVAMVLLDWRLSLLTAAVLPPAVWSTRRVARIRKVLAGQRQRRLAELQSQVDESLSIHGVQLTKILGISERKLADYTASSRELIDLDVRAELAGRWRMMTMQIVFAAIPAAVYLAAGFPRLFPSLTLGTVVAFTGLQMTVFKPILSLLNMGAQWVASMALLSRIFGYLDLETRVPAPTHPHPVEATEVRGEVRFEDVRFQFPDGESPVLDDINLTIPAGSSSASPARPVRASPPWPPSSSAWPTPATVASPSMGSTSGRFPRQTSPTWWAWSARRRTSCTTRCVPTCNWPNQTPAMRSCGRAWSRHRSPRPSGHFLPNSTRWWARAVSASPEEKGSDCRSRGPSFETPRSSCSTRRPAPSTMTPNANCRVPWRDSLVVGRR